MKTKAFITAALLLSMASFGQQASTKTEAATAVTTKIVGKENLNSNAGATIKTNAVNKTEAKTNRTKQQVKKTAIAQKQSVSAQTHSEVRTAAQTVKPDAGISGDAHAKAGAGTEFQGNKTSKEASINKQVAISSTDVKSVGMEKEKQVSAGVKTTSLDARSKTNAAASTSVKGKTAIQPAAKPKLASAKMQTQVKASGGLKIR